MGAFAFDGWLRWLGAGGAALAGLAVLSLAALALLGSGGEQEQAVSGETVTPTTPDVSPTPTSEVPPTPSQNDGALATMDGLPVYEVELATEEDATAPLTGSVLFFTETCIMCIDAPLYRMRQATDGTWVREQLLGHDHAGLPQGYPLSIVHDGEGRFAATWCMEEFGVCGKRHDGTVDDTPRALVMSGDGGVTWEDLGQLPQGWDVAGMLDGEVLIATQPGGVDQADTEYARFPSLEPVADPSGAVRRNAPLVPHGWELHVSDTNANFASPRSTLLSYTPQGEQQSEYLAFPGGSLVIVQAISPDLLLGVVSRNGKAFLTVPPNTDYEGTHLQPVLVDVGSRTAVPISELASGPPDATSHPLFITEGPFARVETGDDECLRVRDDPSLDADVLACFEDGVLLRDRDETGKADGETWLRVETPVGEAGWVSQRYVARLQ